MFFILSKIFWLFASPLHFCILSLALALVLRSRWRFSRALAIFATLALAAIVFSPLSALLLRPLEDRFPAHPALAAPPTGIIVLGGAMDVDVTVDRDMSTLAANGDRIIVGALLAKTYPQAKLVFSGGTGAFVGDLLPEAIAVRRLWRELGVPESQMVFEDRSRNTFENAAFTKAMVAPKPGETWLLVTSAFHMPRSMGIFRAQGMDVTAYPVNFRTRGNDKDFRLPIDGALAAQNFETALREYVGLVAYRLTGKTDALFPAP